MLVLRSLILHWVRVGFMLGLRWIKKTTFSTIHLALGLHLHWLFVLGSKIKSTMRKYGHKPEETQCAQHEQRHVTGGILASSTVAAQTEPVKQ